MVQRFHWMLRHTAVLTLTAALTLVVALTASPSIAHAQAVEGLQVASETRYSPDIENEKVVVQSSYTLTNVTPDEEVGSFTQSFYFTTWVVALPSTATDFAATASGQQLTTLIEPDPDNAAISFASITLPANLNFEERVVVQTDYTIPNGDPRSERGVRVNQSFLSFPVWAAGDPGRTSIRIDAPEGFEIDLQGDLDALTLITVDGQSYYEARDLADPRAFFGRVYGRNDTGLLTETAELPDDLTAVVRAWPDDPEWAQFVVDAIEDDVPVIEELTGLDWPAGSIEVIETVTPYLYGYAGWFNADSGVIEVGESLERDVILHELAHAWFNDDLIDGRWITEGLAEEYASQAIAATGGEQLDPDEPDLADPIRVQLADWASPWTYSAEEAAQYELYHYNASWWVIREITDEIGLDEFSEVLIALEADAMAFTGEGPADTTVLPTMWTHMFDLLDLGTDVSGLDELFSTYVLSEADVAKLGPRRETLARYDAFVESAQPWAAPFVVRRELSGWNFDAADANMVAATEVLDLRRRTDDLAREMAVDIVHQAEDEFESASSTQDLIAALAVEQTQHDALVDLGDDRTELLGSAQDLGVSVSFTPASLGDAATEVRSLRMAINALVAARVQVEERAQELKLTTPPWPTVATSNELDIATGVAGARLATLEGIAAATAQVNAPRSFVQRVGLWRSDPFASVTQARQAFEADQLDQALEATGKTGSLIAGATDVGTNRIQWVLIGSSLLLLSGIGIALARRRYPVK